MADGTGNTSAPPDAPEIERARQLFRFLKAFSERNVPVRRLINEQLWTLTFRDLPTHPAISIGEVRLDDSATNGASPIVDDEPLLRVRRPKLTPAPRPPELLVEFVVTGWADCDGKIDVSETRNILVDGETVTEQFTDDPGRVAALADWRAAWELWATAERPAVQAMNVFERLYDLWGRIERESEQVELLVGDGRLRWRQAEGAVDHPILLQRVELEFDSSGHEPEFRLVDADRGPELYGALLLGGDTLTATQLNQLRLELEQGGYHPLARGATSAYLRHVAQLLGPRGAFQESLIRGQAISQDPVIARDPVLFLRTASTGYPAAFDRVLETLDDCITLPTALSRLVGVEPAPPPDEIERDTSPWGEPSDVLLSKPANLEQIQIARALERHCAVLVQGPPGTGKSHTIANLIGHLVAHGKRVLVTSHTTKALRVLRDQVVEQLQPLCVAVLDTDIASRQQMEQAVRTILSRLTASSEDGLAREVGQLAETRSGLNLEIGRITADLRAAREAEYIPIIAAGASVDPVEGARWVKDNVAGNDWIPTPVDPGAPIPLSETELQELYASSAQLTLAEEREIDDGLPDVTVLPQPDAFGDLVVDLDASEPDDLAPFWDRRCDEQELPLLGKLLDLVRTATQDIARFEPWQRAIVAAGHSGGSEADLWVDLARQVVLAADAWEKSRALLLEYDVATTSGSKDDTTREVVTEIIGHLSNGGSLGRWVLLTKPKWKALIATTSVNGGRPHKVTDFRAIAASTSLEDGRRKLATRWSRQAQPIGMPAFDILGSPPEPVVRDYASQLNGLLSWWSHRWAEIEAAAEAAGFRWQEFRTHEVARSTPLSPFERDVAILIEPMQRAVRTRVALAGRARATRILGELDQVLSAYRGPVCRAIRDAARRHDLVAYDRGYGAFLLLSDKIPAFQRRRDLLARLTKCASKWVDAVRERTGVHGGSTVPGDANAAWKWAELQQELTRRAALDERALMQKLYRLQVDLRDVTVKLIDRRAWLGQIRRTDLPARQALQGWADTQRRIGKGTGKRVPALQAEARRLLAKARTAVPVWIMPLSRVAESFEATRERFDVVIVDEASQSDVTGLLAWYLGDRIAIVGDHEQVSPSAVGQDLTAVSSLIAEHLQGIPNSHLYDGRTSVYDLARQSFGGTIALREHFRCVPDIIEFSNELSYNLEIRPLRHPRTAPQPHVVEYMVQPALWTDRTGKTNLAEARSIVALLKAATEMSEYDDKTFGAITLLGDEQAGLIQDLAVRLIGAVELEQRRFISGNAAQFQGDERHVIFLTMVDTPKDGALPLRQIESFKQRYNVAVSRAKDQLWLVHSLDPVRDLKAGDLRKTLIDYVRNPGVRRRAVQRAERRVESPFESAVIKRLILAGYDVKPQVWVGNYRIDMVVSGPDGEAALECDGDRFHGIDRIDDDMRRQAILERAGWRFIRIRGTRFFRDPDTTMAWVFEELQRLSVEPVGAAPEVYAVDAEASEFRARVVRRAWEIMQEQQWVPTPPIETATTTADGIEHVIK